MSFSFGQEKGEVDREKREEQREYSGKRFTKSRIGTLGKEEGEKVGHGPKTGKAGSETVGEKGTG